MFDKNPKATPIVEHMLDAFMKGDDRARDILIQADRNTFLTVCELVADSAKRMGEAFYFVQGLVESGYKVTFEETDDPEMSVGMMVKAPHGAEMGYKSTVPLGCILAAKESLEKAVLTSVAGQEVN